MVPAYWNYLVGYLVGTGIAVIGLYIAFILPVILRLRLGSRFEPGAWTLGKHYKWIDAIAILWVVFIVFIFLPPYKSSIPWTDDFSWEALNYAPILVGGALVLFGGWYLLSARSGSRARSRWAPRRSSSGWRRRRSATSTSPPRARLAPRGGGAAPAPPPLSVERRRELRLGSGALQPLEVLGGVAPEVEVEL